MSDRLRPTVRRSARLAAFGAVFAAVTGMTAAFGFWVSTNSSASGGATADTLPQGATPSAVTATRTGAGTSTVSVTFAQVSTPAASGSTPITSYYLRRIDGAGATATDTACTGSGTGATTCQETGVPDGTWRYESLARLGSWVGVASTPSTAVTLDTVAPTLTSITRSGTTPANVGPLGFTVTFSEPVKNVAASNFAVASTNITGTPTIGAPSATSPSATWSVSVATTGVTGANNGSIGLNLSSAGSIQDAAGNALSTTSLTGAAYTFDTTKPAASAVATANGGTTAGRPEAGDTITFTFTEPVKPSTILAGWDGTTTNVVVRGADGGSGFDSLAVYNAANTASLPFGTIDLGSKAYFSANVTFGASATASTMVMSGNAVTITFGTVSDATKTGADSNGKSTVTWTPSATVTDLAGNTADATTAKSSANIQQF